MKEKFLVGLLCIFISHKAVTQNASDVMPVNQIVSDTASQTDLGEIALRLIKYKPKPQEKPKKKKKIYYSLLPFASINSYGGQGLVTSTNAGFYLGGRSTTYLSTASFAPYWNFGKRYGFPLRSSLWLKDNTWNIQGDTRFLVYPQFTWGLGNGHGQNDKLYVNYNYIRVHHIALKRIKSYFYGGMGYHLDYHSKIRTTSDYLTLSNYSGYLYGTEQHSNSTSSGLSLDLLYDTRNNQFNPLPGTFANLIYRVNPVVLGSTNTWHSIYMDVRKYLNMNPAKCEQQNVLAFWTYYWTVLDKGAPYFDLPSIGWDAYQRSGRGFNQNRYRGQKVYYFETEYRRDITRNGLLGFVVFANVNTVEGAGTSLFSSWHPAGGTGLRIKFNKTSNTNMALDLGFSKNYVGFELNLGETF